MGVLTRFLERPVIWGAIIMKSKLFATSASELVGVTMALVSKKHVLIALCTAVALTAASQTARADVLFNITGVPQNGFTYGTAPGDDNVINSGGVTSNGSTVVDAGTAPSTWLGSGPSTNSFVSVTGLLPSQPYTIAWFYLGSESNNTIQFTVPNSANVLANGVAGSNEDDRNNNCATCQPGHQVFAPTLPMGSTTFFNDGTNIPAFTLTDQNSIIGGIVTNGGPNPTPANFLASLIFSYATFDGTTFTLTGTPTQFVVFSFNDNGFGDDNHDDFVGVMGFVVNEVCQCGTETVTPIPAALPLFATGLGALGLLGGAGSGSKSPNLI